MAFHQPTTRQPVQRAPLCLDTDNDRGSQAPALTSLQQPGPEESQTWVLFSPVTDAAINTTTTASYLGSVAESQPTPGRSRLSDLGSLNTIARSDIHSQPAHSGFLSSDAVDEDLPEDDAELDSLDSHLPEFRTLLNPYSHSSQQGGVVHAAPVFPSHDGLGSFRLDTQLIDAEAQERIYALERFNPRRVKRRRESLDLAQLELENEQAQELDRTRRIEAWRLEQSQLLLEEVQRETRRRHQSLAAATPNNVSSMAAEADAAMVGTIGEDGANVRFTSAGSDWHDQDGVQAGQEQEGVWSRLTRTVIRDLMGIDDRMLSILFGEALPDEDDLSATPKASAMQTISSSNEASVQHELQSQHDSTRQLHVLERIARELGLLVNQLSAHPGAFATYVRIQQMTLPYAGLPVIHEGAADVTEPQAESKVDDSTPAMPAFRPTLGGLQTQPMYMPGSRPSQPTETPSAQDADGPTSFTQKEWEQDLDIKLVFKYLRSRFTSRNPAGPASFTSNPHLATSSTQDAAAKAARVRQHHPLVSRAGPGRTTAAERRSYRVSNAPSSPAAAIRHHHHHHYASCASQSTRRSARRSSVSSRHYWDIGGSIGTGSLIASTGPIGSWGEI